MADGLALPLRPAPVELGYAVTAHTAQGRITDTAHTVISPAMTREALYVAATRGRTTNTLNVITDHDTRHGPTATTNPDEILRGLLARTGADTSAHFAAERTRSADSRPPGGPRDPSPVPYVRSAEGGWDTAPAHTPAL